MTKRIKIYGERNTGTIYLSKLISLNLDARLLRSADPEIFVKLKKYLPANEWMRDLYFDLTYPKNLGWKHTCVKPWKTLSQYAIVNGDLSFLTITKNPYAWLLSLYRRPYHQHYTDTPDFVTFLQREWKPVGRDNITETPITPIELWNIKNRSYLLLESNNTIHLTTEHVLQNPEAIIRRISEQFAIAWISEQFVNFERSTKGEDKNSVHYRDYYLKEQWRAKLSDEAIEIINTSIDQALMKRFGYEVLT